MHDERVVSKTRSALRAVQGILAPLPVQFTPFIGREQEVAAVAHLLRREEVRLLTLTGPGGIGKTRMALQVAAELSEVFPEGVYFVNLAPISDPDLVVPTIAQTLGLREITGQPLLSLLKTYLSEKHLLLLLDNFEQVVAAAPKLSELLIECPHLKILVTSRAVLYIRSEHEFPVPPLALPDLAQLPESETLSRVAAVALFLQRAWATEPDLQLTLANARAIAEICVQLDGLPLAIELAAARSKLLPPQALLARLDQRLALLTSKALDVPARQRTLRNTIMWSYHLLDDWEQKLFRRLCIFVGGCTLRAVEAICNSLDDAVGTLPILDGVASLIDKSLLRQTEQESQEPRLMMLETIREYGLECLAMGGEMEIVRRTHAHYYLALAEEAEQELGGPQQVRRLEQLEREHDNLRAAMRWSLEQGKAGVTMEMAWRLGDALRWFWQRRGHLSEGRTFLERALAGSQGIVAVGRAKALDAAVILAHFQGDGVRRDALSRESLALFQELGNKQGIAFSLLWQAFGIMERGNYAEARVMLEKAMTLHREVGNTEYVAWSLYRLAQPDMYQGEYARARALCEESLALHRKLGNTWGIAYGVHQLARVLFYSQSDPALVRSLLQESLTLNRELGDKWINGQVLLLLGEVALSQGDMALARSLAEESMALWREIEFPWATCSLWSLELLAKAEAHQGDYARARIHYEEGLALARKVDDKGYIAFYLEGLADLIAVQGEPPWAARLWGAAEALREAIGAPIPPVYRPAYERSVTVARAQFGEKPFAAAWAQGHTMTPEQALAAEDQPLLPTPTPPARSTATYPDGLTAREVEVLRLLAQGLTDAQIAEQLVLSLHTIHAHLRTIYSKLGVTSRSAATRYAFEHQLV